MSSFFLLVFRPRIACLTALLLGLLGGATLAKASSRAPATTVARAQGRGPVSGALRWLTQDEGLGPKAVTPRGVGRLLAEHDTPGFLLGTAEWARWHVATRAALAAPPARRAAGPAGFGRRLLRTALSPNAP